MLVLKVPQNSTMDPLILKQDMIICIMRNSNHKIQSRTLRSQKKTYYYLAVSHLSRYYI